MADGVSWAQVAGDTFQDSCVGPSSCLCRGWPCFLFDFLSFSLQGSQPLYLHRLVLKVKWEMKQSGRLSCVLGGSVSNRESSQITANSTSSHQCDLSWFLNLPELCLIAP